MKKEEDNKLYDLIYFDSLESGKSNKEVMGPKIELGFSHGRANFPKQDSSEISCEINNTFIECKVPLEENAKEPNYQPNLLQIPKPEYKMNLDMINSKKRASLSRFSKRFIPLSSSPRNSKKIAPSLAHLTLQDLLFRQKLLRFIKNMRSHSGLNEIGKLTLSKLCIINDKGAHKNEILKQNFLNDMYKRTQTLRKKKDKFEKGNGYISKSISSLKAAYILSFNTLHLWIKILHTFINEKVPIFKPFGKFIFVWEILLLTLTAWNLISVSLILSFNITLKESVSLSIPFLNNSVSLFVFQVSCLVLYCSDIVMKLNTSIYCDGELVSDRRKIIRKYVRGGLVFDLLGTIPFWQYIRDTESDGSYILFFILFKIYPLQVFFKNINEALLNIEGKLEAAYQLVKLLMTVLIVCHIFACLWHLQALGSTDTNKNWILKLELQSAHWSERYLRSLYFTVVTMTTVGYGDISPSSSIEYLVAMACMLFGSGLIGYSINSIGAILKKKNKGELEYRNKMQLLNGYLKKNNVEEVLKTRVRKYLEYIWKIENSGNERKCEEILKELPKSLREELLMKSRIWAVQKLFAGKFTEQSIKRIVNSLVHVQFSKEEWIFQEGDTSENSLYIIAKGSVDLVLNQGKALCQNSIKLESLKAGENFGLNAFILDEPKSYSAKAATVCSLFKLDRKDFLEIMKGQREDYELYCMMRDKFLLNKMLEPTGRKCDCCGVSTHFIKVCPQLTYQPFRGVIIKRHLFSKLQDRKKYKRKKNALNKVKGKLKLNSLVLSEETKSNLKRFQEDRQQVLESLFEYYSSFSEMYPKARRLSSGLIEDKMVDSREMKPGSKEDFNNLQEPENIIKIQDFPSLKDLEGSAENSNNISPSDHGRRIKKPSILLQLPTNEFSVKTEIFNEPSKASNPPINNASNNYNEEISRPEDLRLVNPKPPKSPTIAKKSKPQLEENNEETYNTGRNNTNWIGKSIDMLYDREFEKGYVFKIYFPYNNKTEIIEKIHTNSRKVNFGKH